MTNKQSIVILGAGFGGLHAARSLSKSLKSLKLTDKYRIILIDKNPYHTYTPTLYEVASTSDKVASSCHLQEIVTFPIDEITSSLPLEFFRTRITKINPKEKHIHTESGTVIEYNYLVVALGSETNYFSVPGLQENSYSLKSFNNALRIRKKITEISSQKKKINIIVGGAGPTGVEFSGEIKQWLCAVPRISQGNCVDEVILVQGAPTILPHFEPKIIAQATKRLKKLGVKIRTSKRVTRADENFVYFNDQEKLPYDILVWTGGVRPNILMNQLTSSNENNIVEVNEYMEISCNGDNVYGLGDSVKIIDKQTNKPVPGVARAAINQAHIVCENLVEKIKQQEGLTKTVKITSFEPDDYPYVLPVGGKFAIAKLGKVVFTGFPGWLLKGVVELNYLLSIMSPTKAFRLWLKGLWVFIRNNKMG